MNNIIKLGGKGSRIDPTEVLEIVKAYCDPKFQTVAQADYEFWVLKDQIDLKETIAAHNTDMQAINNAIQSLDTETIEIKDRIEDHETRITELEQADYDNGTLPLLIVYDNQQRKLYGLNQGGGESQANGAYTFNTQAAEGSPWGDSSGVFRNKQNNQVVKFNLNHYNNTGGTTVHMVTHDGSYHMAEFDPGVWDGTFKYNNITCTVTTNTTNKTVMFEFSEKPQLISGMLFERV